MADVVYYHARVPFGPGGLLDFTVHIKDVGLAAETDQQFVLAVIDKINSFAVRCVPDQVPEAEIPTVLRGVGGRP